MQLVAYYLGILGIHFGHVFTLDFHFGINGLVGATPCRQAFCLVKFCAVNDEFIAYTAQFNRIFKIQFFSTFYHETAIAIIEYR